MINSPPLALFLVEKLAPPVRISSLSSNQGLKPVLYRTTLKLGLLYQTLHWKVLTFGCQAAILLETPEIPVSKKGKRHCFRATCVHLHDMIYWALHVQGQQEKRRHSYSVKIRYQSRPLRGGEWVFNKPSSVI
jgi:hypothetical protein